MEQVPLYLRFKSVSIQNARVGNNSKENLSNKNEIHEISISMNIENKAYYLDCEVITNNKISMLLFYMIRDDNTILVLNYYLTNMHGRDFTEESIIKLLKENLYNMLIEPDKYNDYKYDFYI